MELRYAAQHAVIFIFGYRKGERVCQSAVIFIRSFLVAYKLAQITDRTHCRVSFFPFFPFLLSPFSAFRHADTDSKTRDNRRRRRRRRKR